MNVAVKLRHWKFMNEPVNSYPTIMHSFTQTIKPFIPIYTLKMICNVLIKGIEKYNKIRVKRIDKYISMHIDFYMYVQRKYQDT